MANNKSYSNPAFCQQSEFYHRSSPQRLRQSPVGALTTHHVLDTSIHSVQNEPLKPQNYEEQEFYEEMIVDDTGHVQEKKFVVLHNEGKRFVEEPVRSAAKTRYEYIPMQEQDVRLSSPKRVQYHEEVEASTGRVHRYAVIPADEEVVHQPSGRYAVMPTEEEKAKRPSGRYALVPVEEVVSKNRYAVITPDDLQTNRYEYIEDNYQRKPISPPRKVVSPQPHRAHNPATQKLHELLTTPKKTSHQKASRSPLSPYTPHRIPHQIVRSSNPRAQQKLNYAIGTRHHVDKRNTAIVAPICSSPAQSVYSETTVSNKTQSWMNLSLKKPPVQATLSVAAFMMILCGGVGLGLSFYMISFMGRRYFLDFSIVAGFTCFLLGLLGFRSRNVYWLPNRNYISGYLILSVFSLLSCAGLLVLLFVQPRSGTPMADMTSGAVCGISGLSLLLASSGMLASYCCKVPPPDNRVQHCAQGFTV